MINENFSHNCDISESVNNIEQNTDQLKVIFIDENSDGNPFNDLDNNHGIFTGWNQNREKNDSTDKIEQMRSIGRSEAILFNLKDKGDTLEVGWGGNRFFAEGIYDITKNPMVMLDSHQFDSDGRVEPPQNAAKDNNVDSLVCDIENASNNPQLANKKFGSIIFHGSFFGSSCNYSIAQQVESKGNNEFKKTLRDHELQSFTSRKFDLILESTRNLLSEHGVILMTTDRFSLYSNGREEKELPLEKLEFLNLITKAIKLGAKKITILGVSTNGIKSNFSNIISQQTIDSLSNGIEALPDNTESTYLSPEIINTVKEKTKKLVACDIGIIDAIAIEF